MTANSETKPVQKPAKKPAKRKLSVHERMVRRRAYLFWGAAVIGVSALEWIFPSVPMNVIQFSVAALALYRLLSLDPGFRRVHTAAYNPQKAREMGKAAAAAQAAAKAKQQGNKVEASTATAAASTTTTSKQDSGADFVNKDLNPNVQHREDIH